MWNEWMAKASANIARWGNQPVDVLALCISEEAGEVSQSVLRYLYEGGDFDSIQKEVDDLAALCIQMRTSIVMLDRPERRIVV